MSKQNSNHISTTNYRVSHSILKYRSSAFIKTAIKLKVAVSSLNRACISIDEKDNGNGFSR